MKKVVLFDLDGTLSDTKEGIVKGLLYTLDKLNIKVENEKSLERFIGPPMYKSFMDFCDFDELRAYEAGEIYREYYRETGIYKNKLYDGMRELLEGMKDKTICLATAKPQVFAERILKMHSIEGLFDVIVGSNLDGTRAEKDEVIAEALNHLPSAKKEEAVMVGDRKYDIIGASKCGIDSIGVRFGYPEPMELENAGATYIVDTVDQLRNLLEGL